jgi:hypothetical protein
MTSANVLKSLVAQCSNLQDRASEAAGSMGELIREASEKKGLHRGAFAITKRLYFMGKKNPGKLWLLLAHLDDQREKLGLDKLAEEQGQLVSAGTEDEAEEGYEENENSEGAEVVDLHSARPVSEVAGESAA